MRSRLLPFAELDPSFLTTIRNKRKLQGIQLVEKQRRRAFFLGYR